MSENKNLVVALGGNALEEEGLPPTAESQLRVVQRTSAILADIICEGYRLAVVHGNGPQVGRILLASETAQEVTPVMPYDVCGAMSQGYIGYQIQQCLNIELNKRRVRVPVAAVVTQVVVNGADPAFQNPTKPIGLFYTEEEARQLSRTKGYVLQEDAGRGWRRVVPSPEPQEIVEGAVIRNLYDNTVVIAAGGGGVPVVRQEDGGLQGVAAVIDKDHAACLLAEQLAADTLLILTGVDKVAVNWNTPQQRSLDHLTPLEAEDYITQGQFAKGSMLPKVQAAVRFARSKQGRRAVITSLAGALDAMNGHGGTVIGEPVYS